MSKNIYIKLFLNSSPFKVIIFFPNKQRNILVNNESETSLLLEAFDFIQKSKLDFPIVIFSGEVILTNILNEFRDTLPKDNKWFPVCQYIKNNKLNVQAYTISE